MSEPEDTPELGQLHSFIEEAGTQGTRLDMILDKLKIDHGDVEAIMRIMDLLGKLSQRGLAYSDVIQTRCGGGIMTEIRWFSGERPKGRKSALIDPGFLFFLSLP